MQTGLYRRSRSALPGTAMRAQTLQTRRRGIPREKHSVIVFSTRPARCELASVERRRRPQPRGDVIARTCWRSVLYRGEGAYGRTWANMGKEASKGLIQSFVSAERRVTKHRRRQERREGSAKAFPTRKLTCSRCPAATCPVLPVFSTQLQPKWHPKVVARVFAGRLDRTVANNEKVCSICLPAF
jgi:hypothetical protein